MAEDLVISQEFVEKLKTGIFQMLSIAGLIMIGIGLGEILELGFLLNYYVFLTTEIALLSMLNGTTHGLVGFIFFLFGDYLITAQELEKLKRKRRTKNEIRRSGLATKDK